MANNTQATGGPSNLSNILNQEKSAKEELSLPATTHNFDMYRTLSAVTEDCDGEELGSISITAAQLLGQARTCAKKSHQLATKQSLLLMNRFGASPEEPDEFSASPGENEEDEDEIIRKDSKGSKSEGDEESDQDKLLFESNFVEEKGRANSFNSDFGEEDSKQEESNDSR